MTEQDPNAADYPPNEPLDRQIEVTVKEKNFLVTMTHDHKFQTKMLGGEVELTNESLSGLKEEISTIITSMDKLSKEVFAHREVMNTEGERIWVRGVDSRTDSLLITDSKGKKDKLHRSGDIFVLNANVKELLNTKSELSEKLATVRKDLNRFRINVGYLNGSVAEKLTSLGNAIDNAYTRAVDWRDKQRASLESAEQDEMDKVDASEL